MSDSTFYWHGWLESQLAAYQQDQGNTNHCAKYASATAINLLLGTSLTGDSLVNWLNNRFLRGTVRYTIFGNHNGSLVFQTANQIRKLGRAHNLNLLVKSKIAKIPDLLDSLKAEGKITLVSVTYFKGEEPAIARGNNINSSLASARWIGGHVMILGAYDPGHHNQSGNCTPWGFLSSWAGKDQLYWMTDEDFKRSWGRLSIYNIVEVSRKKSS